MGDSQFTQSLIEILLSWMRLITSWVWNFFQADMVDGFLAWFSDSWKGIAIFLIVVGVVVDWLIWMIRWRPYWVWIRKRQIVYEEVKVPSRNKSRAARPQPVRHMPVAAPSDFDDPFATDGENPYEEPARKEAAHKEESAFEDWEIDADPYAVDRTQHAEYDPAIYARPALGEEQNAKPVRVYPVLNRKEP